MGRAGERLASHWVPCRRIVPGRLYCLRYDMAAGGWEGDKWWPGFAGLDSTPWQHFLLGDPHRFDKPWFYWYSYTGAAKVYQLLIKSGHAYVRGYYNNELDGRTWAGVRYPTVALPLESLAVPGNPSYNMPWMQDAWGDWVQYATGTVVDNAYFRPDPKYLDDPIGTIKLWYGYQPAALPNGWRLVRRPVRHVRSARQVCEGVGQRLSWCTGGEIPCKRRSWPARQLPGGDGHREPAGLYLSGLHSANRSADAVAALAGRKNSPQPFLPAVFICLALCYCKRSCLCAKPAVSALHPHPNARVDAADPQPGNA